MNGQSDEIVILGSDGKTEHVFPAGFDPQRAAAIVRGQSKPDVPKARSAVQALAEWLPAAGGMVGGMTGGIPGAALGGAAGEGYQQLATKAGELPGAAVDVAKNLISEPGATVRGAVEGMGQGLKDSGLQGALQAVYELGGRAVSAGLSTGGRALYRGYLKPSLSNRLLPRAKEIVETGIREALPITEKGAGRAEALTNELNAEVDRILANANGDVNLTDVANQVRQFAKRKYFQAGRPTADYEAAMKVADELDTHPSMPVNPFNPSQPATATLPAANQIKRGLDETIGESNFGVERGATKTTQKVARYGVRKAIESQAPEVAPLNDRMRQLIDLTDALAKATGREANRNQLFGVPSLVSGMTGAAELARGNPASGAAMALATRMGLSPAVASRAAIYAAQLGDKVPGTAFADIARIAAQAVSEASREGQQ